jgi:hypothetical protein
MALTYPLTKIGFLLLRSKRQWIRWIGFWLVYPFLMASMLGLKD